MALSIVALVVGITRTTTQRIVAGALKRLPQPQASRELSEVESWRLYLYEAAHEAGLTHKDYSLLNEIVRCESGWRQFAKDGTPIVSSGNIGLAQINKLAHESVYEKMGLDPNEPEDNLKFAVYLYQRDGIRPWKQWSGHCWLKTEAARDLGLVIE